MRRPRIIPAALGCLVLLRAGSAWGMSIVNTKHDMSYDSTGGGIKTTTPAQKQVCIYCHTPHKAGQNVPLWNKVQTGENFTFYSNSNYLNTYKGVTAPTYGPMPAGGSKLCMSCHDGVTALGTVSNYGGSPGTITMGSPQITGAANIGTDLTNDHPIRYAMNTTADDQLRLPDAPPTGKVRIYDPSTGKRQTTPATNGLVECTSCHDPHDNQYSPFLVQSNDNAAICKQCHNMGPGQYNGLTVHDLATQTVPALGNQATNVLSCMGCHRMHGANTTNGQRYLLRGYEENTCYTCHDGTVLPGPSGRSQNIKAEFNLAFGPTGRHNVETDSTIGATPRHKNPDGGGAGSEGTNYTTALAHSECVDCHNPHEARQATAADTGTNDAPPALYGVSGVNVSAWPASPGPGLPAAASSFTFVQRITKEYQLCLKCHSTALGAGIPAGTTDVTIRFNINNHGYHPVFQVKSTNTYENATTMLSPWNTNGGNHTMRCSHCHNNNNPAATTPRGPHGSSIARILRNSYTPTTTAVYYNPICLDCHNAACYTGTTAGSRLAGRHPGQYSNHDTANGCNTCHGHTVAQSPTGPLEFHGYMHTWPGTPGGGCNTTAGPGYKFMNNTTYFTGWSGDAAGNPACQKQGCSGVCKAY